MVMIDQELDPEACFAAVDSRDSRFDGRFYLGVRTTGIYCRPSCPARTPLPRNCHYFRTAAGAVAAGFRACKRCRPDALPGSREWDSGSDLVSRAIRAIRAGFVDTQGISGLAEKMGVSERHLHRLFIEKVGATPSQLNQTRRSQIARLLIEQTHLSMTEIAYAAGFGSIRQFNDTMALEYGTTPTQLRRASSAQEATVQKGTAELRNASSESLQLSLRLKFRPPYDIDAMFGFFERHTVRGREIFSPASNDGTPATFTRVLDLENGIGKVSLPANVSGDSVHVQLEVPDLSGLPPILQNLRRWLDLDADPTIIGTALRSSEILHPLVSARPGIRIPGSLNPYETSIFTVLGQQVSLAAARTFQTRFIENFGQSSRDGWYAFPALSDLQAIPPLEFQAAIGLTRARSETLSTLIRALVKDVSFDTSEDPASVRQHLHAIRGIGPWTVEYIAMRCLADPDAFPASDLVIQRALGAPSSRIVGTMAEAWKPWRGYAAMHLWEFELQRKKSTEQ